MDDDAEIIAEFLVESHENLDQLDRDLVALEQDPGSRDLLSSIFRTIHTIKGTSGFLALGRLEQLTHVGENLLSKLRDGEMLLTRELTGTLLVMVDAVRALLAVIEETGGDADTTVDIVSVMDALTAAMEAPAEPAQAPASAAPAQVAAPVAPIEPAVLTEPAQSDAPAVPVQPTAPANETPDDEPRRGVADSSVRVDVDLLDDLVQLVGELVLTRNQILQRTEGREDVELLRAAQRLDLVASELQEGIMATRMQPIGQVWSKMPRIVRDLANQLGREVDLDMQGHDTELDRSLLEALRDPLTHLVRNALDHGIQTPAERIAQGKPAKGNLHLKASHESGQVVVEISDDGRGIDPVKIAEAAVRRGVITHEAAARMDPREIVNLVFHAGFSTAEAVTNVSGRGVGMDVVRTNIERIGGTVDITTRKGEGTTVRVRIPLTLAIIPALIVAQADERYAIPQANLVELVKIEGEALTRDIEHLAGAPVLRLRGHLLPLVSLGVVLGEEQAQSDALTVIVVQADDIRFGLCVDDVHDTQEIVVKPIGRQLKSLGMYAGATIMGDGRVSLILDVPGLARDRNLTAVPTAVVATQTATDDTTALLVMEISSGRRAAVPIVEVSRLEEFDAAQVEPSGLEEVVQYRDGILPLIRLASTIGLPETPGEPSRLNVVVHEFGDPASPHRVGIVIDRVLDVVETTVTRSDVGRRPGVFGSAVVQERVTDLVDLSAVINRIGVGA
ncbi:two-component system chemotaxis sensor kinase CheA [Nocardioides daedukensis]|uniref:histidine kinase n=1 Tax=Nocardioides daedukensis TaxID=634462 RepID=A0A7Y9UVS3_9ACTN|nr:chemotaxis protein CheA [Nocardioides daedukensis]NYG58695.1 two-component system chemotaxis sensor kinase CheA [Nocardioides daedukensis]